MNPTSPAHAHQLIITKGDLVNTEELRRSLHSTFTEVMAKRMSSVLPFVHVVSSKTGSGIEELQIAMAEIISQEWKNHLMETS